MRRVLSVLVTTAACVLGFAATTGAAPHPVHGAACTSTYDFGTGLHNDEQGAHADWESNPCGFTMQVRAICVSAITGSVYHHDSGEVHGLEIDDWATCNLLDCMTTAQIDPQDTGHWITKGQFICAAQRARPVLCTEKWAGFVGPPSPGNASVAWSVNNCFHELRVKIHCENTASEFTADAYGGWVMQDNLHSGATCPGNEPALEDAYGQYRVASGDPITTVRFYSANP